MVKQVEEFGAERKKDHIQRVDFTGPVKVIIGEKETYRAKTVIIASGASPNKLGCPGEEKLTGKGVSYCATCDADFFTDLEVFVAGGGDSALEEAMYLTKFARKVTLVHRRDEFRAAKSIVEKASKVPNLEFMLNTTIEQIKGDGIVESVEFKNKLTGELKEHFADEEDGTFGVFIFIGFIPKSELYKGLIDMDESGYIKTDEDMKTNIPGVFAAGDIRMKSLRQVVTATADGAIAAVQADKYLENLTQAEMSPGDVWLEDIQNEEKQYITA